MTDTVILFCILGLAASEAITLLRIRELEKELKRQRTPASPDPLILCGQRDCDADQRGHQP